MFYTIMKTDDIHNDQDVELNKSGNQYNVFFNCPPGQASRTFDTMDEALQVYMRFVDCFARGLYGEQDRMGFLK